MQSFLTACGLTAPLQLVVESPSVEGGELRLFHQPFALIGRDSRADVVLDHARVSRRHVYLQVIEGRAFCVDLESRTGTRVDGEMQKHGWLVRGGQPLCIGPYVIRRIVDGGLNGNHPSEGKPPPVSPLIATSYTDASLPEVVLEFLNGPSQATSWPVRRVMSFIGSAAGCKFRLTDASVSRFHASFLRTSAGVWIVDLLGQGAITVNDVAVRFSHLADGDLLRIGRYQIRVRCWVGRQSSGNRSPDRASAKTFAQPRRRERLSNGLKSANWPASTIPFVAGTEPANSAQFPLAIPAVPSHAKPEIVISSQATFPSLKMAPSESAESMLVPLVNHFGDIQQQMFDQFQQAMAMMLQMFGTMHREQMEVIRGELDRLHDLTEEVHSLRNELANRTQEGSRLAPTGLAAAPKGLDEPMATEPSTSGKSAVSSEVFPKPKPARATAASSSQPVSSVPIASEHQLSSAGRAGYSPQQAPASPVPSGELGEPPLPSRENPDGANATADSERDSIVWLHQRIITLQRERETRWQKILKLLPGVS
jgi:pSer/pThr/pTyr-binding forkhead associated (FHA) protein